MVIFFATSFIWGSLPNMHYNYNCIFPLSSTPSFFLSLWEWKEIILAPPFLRLLSELMGTCLSRPRKHSLCFPNQALVLTFFARGLLQLIGKNKGGKANIRRHAVIVDRGSVLLLSLSPLFPSWFWKSALTHSDSPRLCFHNAVPLLWNFCARVVNFSYLFIYLCLLFLKGLDAHMTSFLGNLSM